MASYAPPENDEYSLEDNWSVGKQKLDVKRKPPMNEPEIFEVHLWKIGGNKRNLAGLGGTGDLIQSKCI
jgi:hypothetical protein